MSILVVGGSPLCETSITAFPPVATTARGYCWFHTDEEWNSNKDIIGGCVLMRPPLVQGDEKRWGTRGDTRVSEKWWGTRGDTRVSEKWWGTRGDTRVSEKWWGTRGDTRVSEKWWGTRGDTRVSEKWWGTRGDTRVSEKWWGTRGDIRVSEKCVSGCVVRSG